MNKFLIATSALLFAVQPLKAGWLRVEDDVILSSNLRTIKYSFGSKDPSYENVKYTKVSSKQLESNVLKNISERANSTLIVFSEVCSQKQVDKILGIAKGVSAPNLSVIVNFHNDATYEIRNYWNVKWSEVCEESNSEDEDYY